MWNASLVVLPLPFADLLDPRRMNDSKVVSVKSLGVSSFALYLDISFERFSALQF